MGDPKRRKQFNKNIYVYVCCFVFGQSVNFVSVVWIDEGYQLAGCGGGSW